MRPGWSPAVRRAFPVVGGVLLAAYWLASSILAYDIIYSVVGVVGVGMVFAGIRMNRPSHPLPWYLILLGEAMLVAGDLMWNYRELASSGRELFPSSADLLYLSGNVPLIMGMTLVIRARTRGRDLGGLIDAAIVAVGVGVVSWVYLVEPYVYDRSMTLAARLISIAYPFTDLLLVALAAQLLFSAGARPRSYYYLCTSLLLVLFSDTVYAVLAMNGAYRSGNPIDYGWLLSYLLWGMAALHPSMGLLSEPRMAYRQPRLTRRRIALLAAAALLAPAVLFVQSARGGPLEAPIIAGGSALLFLLSLIRMSGLVRALSGALGKVEVAGERQRLLARRERVLRRAAAASATALDRESIYATTLDAALELLKGSARCNVSIAAGPAWGMIVVAAAGSNTDWTKGAKLHLGDAPGAKPIRRESLKIVRAEHPDLYRALGLDAWCGEVFFIPLLVRDEERGGLVVAVEPDLGIEVRVALETLAAQTALALESVTLAEGLHRRKSERRFGSLVQNATDIIINLDADGRISYASPSYERILGYSPEVLAGAAISDFVHPDEREAVRGYFARVLEAPGIGVPIELRMRHADGSWRDIEAVTNNLLEDPDVRGVVINARDVTGRKRAEEMLVHQAFHDDLTGLPNRALFMDRVEHALARATRREDAVAVLFLDLDRFKVVNDSLGHEAGDELLVAVGERLRGCLRSEDTVARLGGDEFTVLLEDLEEAGDAVMVAGRITDSFREPILVGDNELFVSASIGVVLSGAGREEPAELLRAADIAMYRAKSRGKSRYELFDQSMNVHALQRLKMESHLRRAVERGELRLLYQPVVAFADRRVVGVESLVRWEHPAHGLIPPADFIPLAEETGLILPLGQWVLEEACGQAQRWRERHPDVAPLIVSVNLSARQFQQPGLSGEVARVLRSTGLDPDLLILEITESVMMDDEYDATLQNLKDLGVRLAVDDFGTGYSSLRYLKHLPVDVLKVDRSFVHGSGRDSGDAAIVRAVIDLARALDLDVVAEGIESGEQLELLRALGCEYGQGYLFARPLPAAGIEDLLAAPVGSAPVV